MDGFGDNFTDPPEVDPAAEFLAREQDELAELEVEIPPLTEASAPMPAQNDDSAGLMENFKANGDDDIGGSFDTLNTIDQSSDNQIFDIKAEAASDPPSVIKEEPEKIKKWREEQKARLEEKDALEEKKKDEWREIARKELEEWYKHHTEAISKTKATNRNAEKQFVAEADEIEPGTEWERIVKLCDFNPKSSRSTSKDVSRMRSIILQLKQNPSAATAATL